MEICPKLVLTLPYTAKHVGCEGESGIRLTLIS